MQMGKVILGGLAAAAVLTLPLHGQSPAGDVFREIDDPHNGDRWLLTTDVNHPGGPGRLFRVDTDRSRRSAVKGPNTEPIAACAAPVIHAGDRIIVEEDTLRVSSRLEAIAMGSALAGSAFNVRLRVGGRVLRAIAVSPGRAVIQEEIGQKGIGQMESRQEEIEP